MKTIRKHFATLTAAEQHQNKLYGQYDHVRLVSSPRFSEDGTYVWEVKDARGPRYGAVPRTAGDLLRLKRG